jgi:hypothetical protein
MTCIPIPIESAPVGTIVQVGSKTPDERIARAEFNRYLFEYFEQLSSWQTGWGVDFNAWLKLVKGWKHLGLRKYERIPVDEDL